MNIPVISPIFGFIIKFLYNTFGQNYLLTLFLFALFVKLLLLPLGIKQQKNTVKQARLRPKEMAIRKKYAGRKDQATQQKMSEEIMKLYQEENVNPMAGCLPLIIQLPVIYALYGVIIKPLTYISSLGKDGVALLTQAYNAVVEKQTSAYAEISMIQKIVDSPETAAKIGEKFTEAAADGGFVWNNVVNELTELHHSFTVFGVDLTVTPSFKFNIYLLIPILTFVFAFFSTKIIRKFTYQPQPANGEQVPGLAMMDWMMPLLSVSISFSVSSAIAVYWIFQNILSAAQQILLYKLFPVPVVTDEQIKEAELQLKGKSKGKKAPVLSDDYYDDYDKTVETDKSGSVKKAQKDENKMSTRKCGISPKVKERIKETGRPLKARRKI